jgi:hypothetical protein
LIKITQNVLFFIDSQFREMADFFQIGIRDIAMTCINVFLQSTTFKAAWVLESPKLLGQKSMN